MQSHPILLVVKMLTKLKMTLKHSIFSFIFNMGYQYEFKTHHKNHIKVMRNAFPFCDISFKLKIVQSHLSLRYYKIL